MKVIALYIILFTYSFSIDFELQNYSASINIESDILNQPFTGGTNYARISWQDWDSDGDMDLFLLDEDKHFKYFRNDGTDTSHEFYMAPHPIQELSGMSWFSLHDFNNDGILELVTQSTANPTHVMYFEYNGSEFIFNSLFYQDTGEELVSSAVMTPTFADIDQDGDFDFFTGNSAGTVNYFMNISSGGEIPLFEFVSSFWEDILIIGPSQARHGASAINFIDLDGDEDLDLAWGDYFQRSLYIIWNEGTSQEPDMNPENFLYQFPETNPIFTSGQNMPSFADLDGDDDMDLFITVLGGDGPIQLNNNFLMYENTGSAADPNYEHVTDNFLGSLDLFSNVVPTLVDINNDGYLDLFVGQDYTNITNPTMGRLYQFGNEGFSHTTWTLQDSAFLGDQIGLSLSPEFVDIDFDEDLDLFVGDYNGMVSYFENIGTPSSPSFAEQEYLNGIDLSFFSTPEFCDIDNDGDQDLFVGSYSGGVNYFKNIGTSQQFSFLESEFVLPDISEYGRTSFEFIDLDFDLDLDLLVGTDTDGLIIYWNIGNQDSYDFIKDTCTEIPYFGYNIKPTTGELGDDNAKDLIFGVSTGGFLHYKFTMVGDVVPDNSIDILDVVVMVNYILSNNNSEIDCSMDINHDLHIDIYDIIKIVSILLR